MEGKDSVKTSFFGWSLLDNSDLNCVFCSAEDENLLHLLGGCVVVLGVWKKVFEWLGDIDDLTLEDFVRFPFAMHKVKNIDNRAIVAVIWLATVWCI